MKDCDTAQEKASERYADGNESHTLEIMSSQEGFSMSLTNAVKGTNMERYAQSKDDSSTDEDGVYTSKILREKTQDNEESGKETGDKDKAGKDKGNKNKKKPDDIINQDFDDNDGQDCIESEDKEDISSSDAESEEIDGLKDGKDKRMKSIKKKKSKEGISNIDYCGLNYADRWVLKCLYSFAYWDIQKVENSVDTLYFQMKRMNKAIARLEVMAESIRVVPEGSVQKLFPMIPAKNPDDLMVVEFLVREKKEHKEVLVC